MISKDDAYNLIEERGYLVNETEDGKRVSINSVAVNNDFSTKELKELAMVPYVNTAVLDDNDGSYWLSGAIDWGYDKYCYEIQRLAMEKIREHPEQEEELRDLTNALIKDGELLKAVSYELALYMDRDFGTDLINQ